MKALSDSELLGEYAQSNSQEAFAELVQRHVNLVYSTALRQVGGDAHLAQDVAQTVFSALARKARGLLRRQTLNGWLYTCARFAGAEAARTESRRRNREEKYMREPLHDPAPEPDWEAIGPMLDAVMGELREKDREAIILRYFENHAYGDVGQRLGISENAARMRVERAVENLRNAFAKHGIPTGAGLGLILAANAIEAAPSGLAATLADGSLAAAGGTFTLFQILAAAKAKCALGILVLATGVAIVVLSHQKVHKASLAPKVLAQVASKDRLPGLSNAGLPISAQATLNGETASISPQTAAPEALLVVGNESDNVVQFDLSTGRWNELAHLPADSKPRGITVSDAGEVFLSLEHGNRNVVKIIPGEGGVQLKDISRSIGRYGPGMLAFNRGQILTAGDTERLIYIVNPETGDVLTPPQFINSNNIVGFTIAGDALYAGEYFQRSIIRYEMGMEAKPSKRLVSNDPHLDKPVGLTIGHNGNLYVASRLEPAIVEFDLKTGAYVRTLIDLGLGSKEGIYGLVYAPATRCYYISAGSNVYEVDPDGNLLAIYNSPALKAANAIALIPAGIRITLAKPAAPASATQLAATRSMTLLKAIPGKLIITGQPGERYRVLATTNFVAWELFMTLQNTAGTVECVLTQATKFDRRFFRLELLMY
jgi:RNA polymerase sigma factor (sigma-70 family)